MFITKFADLSYNLDYRFPDYGHKHILFDDRIYQAASSLTNSGGCVSWHIRVLGDGSVLGWNFISGFPKKQGGHTPFGVHNAREQTNDRQ